MCGGAMLRGTQVLCDLLAQLTSHSLLRCSKGGRLAPGLDAGSSAPTVEPWPGGCNSLVGALHAYISDSLAVLWLCQVPFP